MKRPSIVTAVIAIHRLAMIVLITLSFYLLWLARSPETLNEQDAAGAVQGLRIGALALGIPGLLWIPGIYGMLGKRVWGWWLSLTIGTVMASVLIYSAISDGWKALDFEDAAVTVAFVILPLSLLLPQVRKYCQKAQDHSSENATPGIAQPTS